MPILCSQPLGKIGESSRPPIISSCVNSPASLTACFQSSTPFTYILNLPKAFLKCDREHALADSGKGHRLNSEQSELIVIGVAAQKFESLRCAQEAKDGHNPDINLLI